jgi:uncharacterized protein YndB with AHSA1/START domain
VTARRVRPPVLVMTRVIRVPRERVFRAWTDADMIKQWWGRPEGVGVSEVEVDLRVDGNYRIVMTGPDGSEFPLSGKFVEVRAPERLAYSFKWERDLPFPGGDYTEETQVTVEFRDLGSQTEIVLTHEGFASAEISEFHDLGWGLSFDRLTTLCEKDSADS